MPSKSWAQHKLMEAVKHDAAFAEKVGIPQKVGDDFAAADLKAGITKTHNGKPIGHGGIKRKGKGKAAGW
jgi:hypothetical protein